MFECLFLKILKLICCIQNNIQIQFYVKSNHLKNVHVFESSSRSSLLSRFWLPVLIRSEEHFSWLELSTE